MSDHDIFHARAAGLMGRRLPTVVTAPVKAPDPSPTQPSFARSETVAISALPKQTTEPMRAPEPTPPPAITERKENTGPLLRGTPEQIELARQLQREMTKKAGSNRPSPAKGRHSPSPAPLNTRYVRVHPPSPAPVNTRSAAHVHAPLRANQSFMKENSKPLVNHAVQTREPAIEKLVTNINKSTIPSQVSTSQSVNVSKSAIDKVSPNINNVQSSPREVNTAKTKIEKLTASINNSQSPSQVSIAKQKIEKIATYIDNLQSPSQVTAGNVNFPIKQAIVIPPASFNQPQNPTQTDTGKPSVHLREPAVPTTTATTSAPTDMPRPHPVANIEKNLERMSAPAAKDESSPAKKPAFTLLASRQIDTMNKTMNSNPGQTHSRESDRAATRANLAEASSQNKSVTDDKNQINFVEIKVSDAIAPQKVAVEGEKDVEPEIAVTLAKNDVLLGEAKGETEHAKKESSPMFQPAIVSTSAEKNASHAKAALQAMEHKFSELQSRVEALTEENFQMTKTIEHLQQFEERRRYLGTESPKVPFDIVVSSPRGKLTVQVNAQLKVGELIRRVRVQGGFTVRDSPSPRITVDRKQMGHMMTLGEAGVSEENKVAVEFSPV